MYRLFLDDVRQPAECIHYMYQRIGARNPMYLEDWIVVKNYDEFVAQIQNDKILPSIISLDHDLADVFYDPITTKEYFEYQEKTGYDCLKWLINYVIENNLDLPECIFHTANEVGRENMEKYLENYYRSNDI